MGVTTFLAKWPVARIVLLAIALSVSLSFSAGIARAQEPPADTSSIALTPVITKSDIKAGNTSTDKIKVINNGTTTYTFTVYSRPFSVKNEAYTPQFETGPANSDLYQWITFSQTSYTLKAGERVDVPYNIHVPASAAPGGHYGIIFAETVADPNSSNSVVRQKRIGSIVAVNVAGDVTLQGKLIESVARFWQTTPPLTLNNRVENTGNTDFSATIQTSVKDMFGGEKNSESKDYIVYPGTVRDVASTWEQSPWFGLFKVDQKITILGKTANTTHYVLMAPRWLVIILTLVIISGVGYALLRRKHS